jgi:hypothetical protein
MNKIAAFGLLALVLGVTIGCEQQTYEETRMFNQSSHATGGHGHGAKHEDGKTGESEHKDAPVHKETKE